MKKIVLVGSFRMSKVSIVKLVTDEGIEVCESLNKDVDTLVAGSIVSVPSSEKLSLAETLGVRIIDEQQLLEYLDGGKPVHTPITQFVDVKTTTPSTVDETINERGERYGKFSDGAEIMQTLKNTMRDTPNWQGLSCSQRESLEMIQHKIGRILNGDPNYDDNWRDICGYSQLVLDELNGTKR